MKRKVYTLIICLFALSITGCNNNRKPEETKTQESSLTLENPSMNIQNNKDYLGSFYTNFVIQDKYRVYRIIEKSKNMDINIAIPDWQPEGDSVIDTADFVNAIDDEMSDITQKRIDFLKEKLKPSGMSKEWKDSKQIYMGYAIPYIKGYTSDIIAEEAVSKRRLTETIGLWDFLLKDNKETINKYNIFCISINMYEGFYHSSNATKLLLYGVPEETFKDTIKIEDGKSVRESSETILEKYNNGECKLDILTDIELTKSGNYYMDFSEIIANNTYQNIILKIELTGEVTNEYTYAWYGFAYKIDNEQAYQDWKAKNTDKFVY